MMKIECMGKLKGDGDEKYFHRASERDAANARWGPAKPAFSLEILEASACMDGRKEGEWQRMEKRCLQRLRRDEQHSINAFRLL